MRQIWAILLLTLSVQSSAKDNAALSASAMIRNSHKHAMNFYFLKLSNLAVKHKKARDFFAAALELPANSEHLKVIGENERTPKIVLITDGYEISSKEGERITVKLGKELGTLEIDGMKYEKKKSAFFNFMRNTFDPLPTAEATTWDWIWTRGLGNIVKGFKGEGEVVWKSWGPHTLPMPMAERAILISKGTAYASGEAAILGCALALHFNESEKLQNCGYGALTGAGLVVGAVSAATAIAGAGTVLGIGAAAGIWGVEAAVKALPEGARAVMAKAAAAIPKIGVAAVVAHSVDSLIKSDGIRLICTREGKGAFIIEDLSLTGPPTELYSFNSKHVYFQSLGNFPYRFEDTAKFISGLPKYNSMGPDEHKTIANSVMADVENFKSICEKHGIGYSDTFRIEFDKKSVEVGKPKGEGKAKTVQ